jgi:DNA-binding NarL/FixJ family response regulator
MPEAAPLRCDPHCCGSRHGGADCAEATKISIKRPSRWQSARQHLPHDVLIVAGAAADVAHLSATLRVLLGYRVPIRGASSLDTALVGLTEHRPSHVFIAATGSPSIDAATAIAELRRAGYEGPVIVVCDDGSHAARTRLTAGGAGDVIHKDDLCSARIAEAFDRANKLEKS